MKHVALILALASPVAADGLNSALTDPVVAAPHDAWTGPYVGLTYGRTTSSAETVECFKLDQPKACDDPIFAYYPEYKVEVRSQIETTDGAAGVMLGYRFDLGRVVPGVEVAVYGGEAVPGINLGLDLGNLLPYAHLDRDGAAAGIEARISPRLTAGIRGGENGAALTIGWAW